MASLLFFYQFTTSVFQLVRTESSGVFSSYFNGWLPRGSLRHLTVDHSYYNPLYWKEF